MTDALDEYCPPGFLRSTFTFGTGSGSFTSISMAIEEVVDVTATVATHNSATQSNPDLLTSVPAVVGSPYSASLTLGRARTKGAGTWVLYFGTTTLAPNGVPLGQFTSGLNFGANKAGRMLLANITGTGFNCIGSHTGISGSTSTTACGGGGLPKSIGLVNNAWSAQAIVLGAVSAAAGGGNARLSSAVYGTVGNL
jgi:hypothetical protein